MPQNYLFIGGSANGQIGTVVDNVYHISLPVRESPFEKVRSLNDRYELVAFREEHYRKITFMNQKEAFIHDSITTDMIEKGIVDALPQDVYSLLVDFTKDNLE